MPERRRRDPVEDYRRDKRLDLCFRVAAASVVTEDNPLPELIRLLGFEKAMEFMLVFRSEEHTSELQSH